MPDLSYCTLLEELELHENYLDGPIPLTLANCPRLRNLKLSKNCLTGTVLASR
jgi:hypothetical protein